MSKLNQILIVVLVIQIGLGVFTLWPQSAATAAGEPLLNDFSADEVVELVISDGDDNRIALAKAGEAWVLPEAGDFPADGEKINPFLEKLGEVESGRLVTQTEGSHTRLEVATADFNRRLDITRQGGQQDTLYVGSSAGASATHVRLNDQSEVYLTGAVTSFEANATASGWIDAQYFTIPQSTTTTITLKNENGTFKFERVGEEWTLDDVAEGEIVSQSGVSTLLTQSHAVRMVEPVGVVAEAGAIFDTPLASITIEAADQTYRLQLAALENEEDGYYFVASSSPYYVRLDKFTGDNFVTKTRADFLEMPSETGEGGGN